MPGHASCTYGLNAEEAADVAFSNMRGYFLVLCLFLSFVDLERHLVHLTVLRLINFHVDIAMETTFDENQEAIGNVVCIFRRVSSVQLQLFFAHFVFLGFEIKSLHLCPGEDVGLLGLDRRDLNFETSGRGLACEIDLDAPVDIPCCNDAGETRDDHLLVDIIVSIIDQIYIFKFLES